MNVHSDSLPTPVTEDGVEVVDTLAKPAAKPARARKASVSEAAVTPNTATSDPVVAKPRRRKAVVDENVAQEAPAIDSDPVALLALQTGPVVDTQVQRPSVDSSTEPERPASIEGLSDAGLGGMPAERHQEGPLHRSGDSVEDAAVAGAAALAPAQAVELFAKVLSGEFDAADDDVVVVKPPEAVEPPKRVLLPEPEAPKLHKVLAQSGVGSRRDMEALIEDGHVSVNGRQAHVGQRVSFGDQVKVHGKPVRLRIAPHVPRIIAYHKPAGEIVTHDDPQNRPTVFRRLPRLPHGKWQSVGRLDINTEGLLLFTDSGDLANQLMHPRFGVEREYAVRVLGVLTEAQKATLLAGVEIEGQKASFLSIVEGGGDGANHWYRVVITEGRNREVRKLFDTQGLTVSRLIRIRYGTIVLPLGLKRGVWVDLPDGDVDAVRRLASRGPGPGGHREGRGSRSDERGNHSGSAGGGHSSSRSERSGHRAHPGERRDHAGGPRPSHSRGRSGHEGPLLQPPRERDLHRDDDADFDPASIPNPLEQTFDKRFATNPRSPVGGRGFGRGGGGFGAGGSAPEYSGKKRGPGGVMQPDPLQTSLGFIGADAFHRKGKGGGGRGGGGRGGGGNYGGGQGGGGRRGR